MSRAFRLGLFVFGALLLLAVGVFLIGAQQMLFQPTYRIQAQFQNVSGLADGADVRVGGIHNGTVRRIQLPHRPDEKVTVVMDLEAKTRDVVKEDSMASIKSEGLMGDKYVEVSFGSSNGKQIKSGDMIGTEPPIDVSDLFKKADQILDSAKGTMQNAEATTGEMKDVATKINQGKGTVGALINDRSIYQHADAAIANMQENMEALKHNFFLRGFFKKRGFEDSEDLTRHQIARLPTAPAQKSFDFDPTKIFDKPDTAKLKNTKPLDEAGKFLESSSYGLAVVASYTGMAGDSEKDRMLTEARAMVVRDYLTKHFRFDDTRLKTAGLGKSPDAPNNGKLEVLVYSGQVDAQALKQAKAVAKK